MCHRLQSFMMRNERVFCSLTILGVITICFSMWDRNFLTADNFVNIFVQNTPMIVMILGLAVVMIGGNYDLSIGWQISLITVIIGRCFIAGFPILLTIVAAILTGMGCGAVNGAAIRFFGIPSFVLTIFIQQIYRGLSFLISGGVTLFDIPDQFRSLYYSEFLSVPMCIWIALACLIAIPFIMSHTVLGIYIYAMGANEKILDSVHQDKARLRICSYVISGFMMALSALLLVARQGACNSAVGSGVEISGIMAAYLGGYTGAFSRRRENEHRTHVLQFVLGLVMLAVMENGLQMIGGYYFIQYFVEGLLLFLILFVNRQLDKLQPLR